MSVTARCYAKDSIAIRFAGIPYAVGSTVVCLSVIGRRSRDVCCALLLSNQLLTLSITCQVNETQ